MLHIICGSCQLFQCGLFIQVLRWNLAWLEPLFLGLLVLFLCHRRELGFHLSGLICCDLFEAVGSLLSLLCKNIHQPCLLGVSLGVIIEIPFFPYFPSQISIFQNICWTTPARTTPSPLCSEIVVLHWAIFSTCSNTQLTLQTRPLCDTALPLAIFNQCLQSLPVLSATLLSQNLDLKVVTFPGMQLLFLKSQELSCVWWPEALG